jgi:hypothetical protein
MLHNFGFIAASVCLLLGAVLLYDGISRPDAIQALRVIGGAVLLSLGLFTIWLVLKTKLEWRRNYRSWKGPR